MVEDLFIKAAEEASQGTRKILKLIQFQHEMGLSELEEKQLGRLCQLLEQLGSPKANLAALGAYLADTGHLLLDVGVSHPTEKSPPVASKAAPTLPPDPGPVAAPPTPVTAPTPATVVAPAPTQVVPPARPVAPPVRVVPPARPVRTWIPRPPEEVKKQVDWLQQELQKACPGGEMGLLRLKILACHYRRLEMEKEDLSLDLPALETIGDEVQRVANLQWSDHTILPLDPRSSPKDPEHWTRLAEGYAQLGAAVSALPWLNEHLSEVGPAETRAILEGCNAAQQLLFRVLDTCFDGLRDDQQRWVFRSTMNAADSLGIRLAMGHVSDKDLREYLPRLEQASKSARDSIERKIEHERTIQSLLALVERPGFGKNSLRCKKGEEQDRTELTQTLNHALDTGLVGSNKTVREALTPWVEWLREEPRFAPIVREIDLELARHQENLPAEEDEDQLSLELQMKLEELLPYTRAREVVFLGGNTDVHKQKKIKEVLQLKDLYWPATKPTQSSIQPFEAAIRHADIAVLLIRFMRSGFDQAREVAKKYDTQLVRLPRGLGLSQIITNFHDQLVPR